LQRGHRLLRIRRGEEGRDTGERRQRPRGARGLSAYAGAAPVTRASGKSRVVLHRRVKNQRLAAAGYI
jgi:hypothetical protein